MEQIKKFADEHNLTITEVMCNRRLIGFIEEIIEKKRNKSED
jgi:hypothetical protein